MGMNSKHKLVLLLLLLHCTTLFSRSQTITVYDVPQSTRITIKKLQNLEFGSVLVATEGTIAVNNLGQVFVSGDVVSTNQVDVVPSICEIIFTPFGWEPDTLFKTVNIIVTTNEILEAGNSITGVSFDFEDITKGKEESVRDGKDIITLTIGGILYVTRDSQSDYYGGKINVSVEEL